MNAVLKSPVGDYDLRGRDIETCMVSEVHGTLIDADRLVRVEFSNGFPNWELFRTVYACDYLHIPMLKRWVHEFAIAACMEGQVKRTTYTPTLAGIAGLDALYLLIYREPMLPHTVMAADLGVTPKTYKRLRDGIRDRLSASLNLYILHLGAAYRQVLIYERKSTPAKRVLP
jgi:hypothetical protein